MFDWENQALPIVEVSSSVNILNITTKVRITNLGTAFESYISGVLLPKVAKLCFLFSVRGVVQDAERKTLSE